MLDKLLELVYRITRHRAYLVVGLFVVLVVLSLIYIFPFPIRSSMLDLLPQNDPIINEYRDREKAINSIEYVTVALSIREGSALTEEQKKRELRAVAEELKPLLREIDEIETVSYQNQLSIPEQYRLIYSLNDNTIGKVEALEQEFDSHAGDLTLPGKDGGVGDSYTELLDDFDKTGMGEELDREKAKQWLTRLGDVNSEFLNRLEGLDRLSSLEEKTSTLISDLDQAWEQRRDSLVGEYFSGDNSTLLLLCRPTEPSSHNLEFSRTVTEKTKTTIRELKESPVYDETVMKVGLTGSFIINAERNDALKMDMLKTTIISSVGIMVAFFFALGSLFYSILIGFPLVVAVLFTMSWAKFSVNGFNLLSTFLPALVLGLSIDYGIHLLFRFTEERSNRESVTVAIKKTIQNQGKGIFLAALTTASVFAMLILSNSRGLVEMGIITSPGIMISFFVYLFLLPALLVVYQRWWGRREPVVLFDYRSKLRGLVDLMIKRRKTVLLLTLVISALALAGALQLRFQFTSTDVATEVESSRVEERVQGEFSGSNVNIGTSFIFFADSFGELERIGGELKELDVIRSVNSIRDFVPEGVEVRDDFLQKAEELPDLEAGLEGVKEEINSRDEYVERLESLVGDLSSAQFSMTLSSQSDLSVMINENIDQLLDVRGDLKGIDREEKLRTIDGLQQDLSYLDEQVTAARDVVEHMDNPKEIKDIFPEGLRSNYITDRGEYVMFAQVETRIYESKVLSEFIDEVENITDDYFGLPLIQSRLEDHIKRDFYVSSLFALLVIIFVLFRGIRDVRLATLATIPLFFGYLWMLGGMDVMGMNFNFINIIISPLLIGIGVDDGIHLIYRWQEEREEKSLREAILDGFSHTGLAVITTSVTTIAVFGSLLIARTPGLRILGLTALLGIGFAMVLSLTLLPVALFLAFHGDEK